MLRRRLCLALAPTLLAPLLAAGSYAPHEPPEEPLALARRYLDAYAHLDLDTLRGFWTEESVWCDPTTAELGLPARPVVGGEAIAESLRTAMEGTTGFGMDFDHVFHSAGYAVASGSMHYDLPAAALGRSEGDAHFEMRTVIVLRLENGKVVQHTDYADFSRWREMAVGRGR